MGRVERVLLLAFAVAVLSAVPGGDAGGLGGGELINKTV